MTRDDYLKHIPFPPDWIANPPPEIKKGSAKRGNLEVAPTPSSVDKVHRPMLVQCWTSWRVNLLSKLVVDGMIRLIRPPSRWADSFPRCDRARRS